jgi:hypothetical protein
VIFHPACHPKAVHPAPILRASETFGIDHAEARSFFVIRPIFVKGHPSQ